MHTVLRLRGGKPVKVQLLTGSGADGAEVAGGTTGAAVVVDIEADTPMWEVKRRLAEATGVPVQHQKVMLAGIGQLVMADKRSSLGFSHCGRTNNMYFATLNVTPPAAAGGGAGATS